jgi:GrpB-like predicted nucleotidyltransferase (UPF0157 family)
MSPHQVDEPLRIRSYDPTWPSRYEAEQEALGAAIGRWVVGGIHHVGSTAVPGLDAKPIIDILVGVEDLPSSRACFEPLACSGEASRCRENPPVPSLGASMARTPPASEEARMNLRAQGLELVVQTYFVSVKQVPVRWL